MLQANVVTLPDPIRSTHFNRRVPDDLIVGRRSSEAVDSTYPAALPHFRIAVTLKTSSATTTVYDPFLRFVRVGVASTSGELSLLPVFLIARNVRRRHPTSPQRQRSAYLEHPCQRRVTYPGAIVWFLSARSPENITTFYLESSDVALFSRSTPSPCGRNRRAANGLPDKNTVVMAPRVLDIASIR